MRDRFVQPARAGKVYDVDPLGPREIVRAIERAGMTCGCVTVDALTEMGRIERPTGAAGLLVRAPGVVQRAVRPLLPTMVYLLRPAVAT